jgi:hypothetical protein
VQGCCAFSEAASSASHANLIAIAPPFSAAFVERAATMFA